MSVINKPDFKVFAQDAKNGEIETFPNVLRGWGVTLDQTAGKPPMEWFNALGRRVDEWLLYLTQRGIAEWDASVDYPKTAFIQYAGIFYIASKQTKNEQPNTSQNSWKPLFDFLGFPAMGIGLSNRTPVNGFDWQQADFLTASVYAVNPSAWTNAPKGVAYDAGTPVVYVEVDGIVNATTIDLTLTPSTPVETNYKVFKVRVTGAKGARTFKVRQIYTNVDLADANGVVGRLLNVQTFTSSGTYTPTPGTKFVIVEGVGGGGAGGGAPATSSGQISYGNGGTSGTFGRAMFTAGQIGDSIPVTVGARGAGVVGATGGAGGTSSFGSLLVLPGGLGGGGRGPIAPPIGLGGAAASGTPPTGANILSVAGAPGEAGFSSSIEVIVAGLGGHSFFGGPSARNVAGSVPGVAYNKGAGGTGSFINSSAGAIAGGAGGQGFFSIWEYA